jgi:hypothetical protein
MMGGQLQSETSRPGKDRDSELLHLQKEQKKRTSPPCSMKTLGTDMHIMKTVKR